jgi:DMSO/TMAO reductase YedYZ molybdopterin-dependent catalytic subunit
MRSAEVVNGNECSGNSARSVQGLSSNGRFTGVRLRDVLQRVGVYDKAREVVFFGADKGNEDVVFRQQTLKMRQQRTALSSPRLQSSAHRRSPNGRR